MERQKNLDSHGFGPCSRLLNVIDLEPKKQTITLRFGFGIANESVMIFDIPPMQLQHQFTRDDDSLVVWSAMSALAIEQATLPEAARDDVGHANQRLRSHPSRPRFHRARNQRPKRFRIRRRSPPRTQRLASITSDRELLHKNSKRIATFSAVWRNLPENLEIPTRSGKSK